MCRLCKMIYDKLFYLGNDIKLKIKNIVIQNIKQSSKAKTLIIPNRALIIKKI